ncbi:MAG: glutathione S-transferase family protein [Pseudomonadota bacterium]
MSAPASRDGRVATIKFHYFYGRGIGEPIRLIFTAGGVDFEDVRYSIEEFGPMDDFKARLPFGQMPALQVDDVFIGQTDSITRFAARSAGLYPEDPLAAAHSDMVVVHQAEIQSTIAKMSFDGVPGAVGTKQLPEAEREARIGEFWVSKLPAMLERLERLAAQGHMVGGALSWADVCVFNRFNQLLDRDPALLDGAYPQLKAVYDNVADLPSIQGWIQSHPEDYPRQHGN